VSSRTINRISRRLPNPRTIRISTLFVGNIETPVRRVCILEAIVVIKEFLELTGAQRLTSERPFPLAYPPDPVAFQELRKAYIRFIDQKNPGLRKGKKLFHRTRLCRGHLIGITNRDAEDNLHTVSYINCRVCTTASYGSRRVCLFDIDTGH
jgi:hypothetical protein